MPLYRQIADDLRQQIAKKTLSPGQRLAAEADLAHKYGVGVDTVRDALALLRTEGVVRTVRGEGSYIREQAERVVLTVEGPALISARMPSADEKESLDMPEGVPVLVLEIGEETRILPAHETKIEVSGPES
ncbi:GntR family transcriptional regulator [Streptosporangium sp. NPDC020145]|uniref:GntR family transcriptional regulator n=1 Tax=Streptosporangium sp. NPDC020145 TaxID=3154694 RepID=UPI0034432FAB